LVKLTTLISACIRLDFIPDAWKTAEVIMFPKPGKNLSEVELYRSVSLMPIVSKLFEKLILKRLKSIIADKHRVPTHQFGFRKKSLDKNQVYRVTDIIEKTPENKGVCSAVFLDLAQAFDRV
jgi:hypothetical protein